MLPHTYFANGEVERTEEKKEEPQIVKAVNATAEARINCGYMNTPVIGL